MAFPDMKLFMAMCKYLVSNTLSKYVFNRNSRKDEKFNIVFDQLIVNIDEFLNSIEIQSIMKRTKKVKICIPKKYKMPRVKSS